MLILGWNFTDLYIFWFNNLWFKMADSNRMREINPSVEFLYKTMRTFSLSTSYQSRIDLKRDFILTYSVLTYKYVLKCPLRWTKLMSLSCVFTHLTCFYRAGLGYNQYGFEIFVTWHRFFPDVSLRLVTVLASLVLL